MCRKFSARVLLASALSSGGATGRQLPDDLPFWDVNEKLLLADHVACSNNKPRCRSALATRHSVLLHHPDRLGPRPYTAHIYPAPLSSSLLPTYPHPTLIPRAMAPRTLPRDTLTTGSSEYTIPIASSDPPMQTSPARPPNLTGYSAPFTPPAPNGTSSVARRAKGKEVQSTPEAGSEDLDIQKVIKAQLMMRSDEGELELINYRLAMLNIWMIH